MRLVLAVIAGYLLFGLSAVELFRVAGVEPHAPASTSFVIFSIVYGVVFAAAGGVIATGIARQAKAALLVAAIIALGALVSIAATYGKGVAAAWSPLAALLLMSPAAALAGRWWARRAAR